MNLIHGKCVYIMPPYSYHRTYVESSIFKENKRTCVEIHEILICFIFFSLTSRFNYRATAYMVERGFYQFLNWFDERAWYPLGRIVGGTVYPGLMITSGGIHWLLHALNIPVHIRDICVFLAPIFR